MPETTWQEQLGPDFADLDELEELKTRGEITHEEFMDELVKRGIEIEE